MAYTPKFKWTDELVMEFAKLSTMGSYGIFEDTKRIEDKLSKFKEHKAQKTIEERIKRVTIGKRGMNDDGSRFYYDLLGVKWNIKRVSFDGITFYSAESNNDEALRTKFLSDVYIAIDKRAYNKANDNLTIADILK